VRLKNRAISSSFLPPSDSVKSSTRTRVVQEVLLDGVAAVAEAQDEGLVAEMGVVLHHVPKNRPVADRDQRLRHVFGVADSKSETPQNSTTFMDVFSQSRRRTGGQDDGEA
jgi:hypothetical protein